MSGGRENGIQARTVAMLEGLGAKVINTHGTPFAKAGTPDLIGSIQGHAFAIELKKSDGRLSELQEIELGRWLDSGAIAFPARSPEEAVAQLLTMLRLRGVKI